MRKIKEVVIEKDIDRWEKESKQLSKNIRRIETVSQFKQVRSNFIDWAVKFEEFVFKNIYKADDPDIDIKLDNKSVNAFIMFIKTSLFDFFSRKTGLHSYSFSQYYNVDERGKEKLDAYPVDAQEIIIDTWKGQKDYFYQKYNKLRREAFEALYTYWGYINIEGRVKEYYKTLPDKISGIDIEWKISEVEEEKEFENLKERIQGAKEAVEKGIELLQNKMLLYLLKDVSIIIETTMHFEYAGKWDGRNNRIILVTPLKSNRSSINETVRALIHEVGHRYADEIMSREQRRLWETFIFEDIYTLTKEDIEKFYEYGVKAYKDLGYTYKTGSHFSEGNLYLYIKDSKTQYLYDMTLFNEFWDSSKFFLPSQNEKEMVEEGNYSILYDALQEIIGSRLYIGAVSSYSTKRSGIEFFPEAFSYFVMGYDMPVPTRELIKNTIRV